MQDMKPEHPRKGCGVPVKEGFQTDKLNSFFKWVYLAVMQVGMIQADDFNDCKLIILSHKAFQGVALGANEENENA